MSGGDPDRTAVAPAWSEDDLSRSVTDRFARVASALPERTALTDTAGRTMTYSRLAASTMSVARALLGFGQTGSKVGLLSDLSIATIPGMLGIVAAGCAYVPVDSTESPQRAAKKLVAADARSIVVPAGLEALAGEMAPGLPQITVDIDAVDDWDPSALPRVKPDDHFNLIFTSGSTGEPKGVIQTHRNVLFDTRSSNEMFPYDTEDRFGLVIPMTFGASVSDVAGALLNGARLDLFDLKTQGLEEMTRWMDAQGITVTHVVPTVLRRWLMQVEVANAYPAMRLIKAGGEPLFRSDLELFGSRFGPEARLRNGLGTTETYLVAAAVFAPGDTVDSPIVPIGEPAPGRKVTIVDPDGRQVPRGEVGEIHVHSAYLSPGYWNDPAATASSFGETEGDPARRTYRTGDLGRVRPDGQLEHLGRVDDMVKVAGQAVHLTDVETSLVDVDGVIEASVVAVPNASGDTRLVGDVVTGDQFPGSGRARAILAERFPPHMIPSRIVVLDSLPTLPFGKVDRRALAMRQDTDFDQTRYRAPESDLEEALAAAAASALGIERVGVDDDLFALGLDSLTAVQLVARVRGIAGVGLAIDAIFETPTIAALAEAVGDVPTDAAPIDLDSLLDEVEQIGEIGASEALRSGQR